VNRPPQIFLMNRDGTGQQMLVSLTGGAAFPSFSHNGAKLCFHSQAAPRDIYVVNIDGTNLINLTAPLPGEPAAAGANIRCDWSAKKNAIAFTSDRDGDQDIYVVEADGSGLRQLTDAVGSDANPAFSPKGDLIAFESNRDTPPGALVQNPEIYVMNADGSNQVRLTFFLNELNPSNVNVTKPTWSPKGDRISFHRRVLPNGPGTRGHLEIFTMNSDGSDVTRLTFTVDPGFSGFPSWAKWSTPE
ncbi:MAG: PD40 domain-containing protein, partial [Acidobacteria bacterium]|nr:PD40 domain-containing protein [Acidobacteriota bacterium]